VDALETRHRSPSDSRLRAAPARPMERAAAWRNERRSSVGDWLIASLRNKRIEANAFGCKQVPLSLRRHVQGEIHRDRSENLKSKAVAGSAHRIAEDACFAISRFENGSAPAKICERVTEISASSDKETRMIWRDRRLVQIYLRRRRRHKHVMGAEASQGRGAQSENIIVCH